MVATFSGQLLGTDGLSASGEFLIAFDEVVDAQVVDIGIVSDALTREVLAEVVAVGANGLSQLLHGEVVLQVELCVYTVLVQLSIDLGKVNIGDGGLLGWARIERREVRGVRSRCSAHIFH